MRRQHHRRTVASRPPPQNKPSAAANAATLRAINIAYNRSNGVRAEGARLYRATVRVAGTRARVSRGLPLWQGASEFVGELEEGLLEDRSLHRPPFHGQRSQRF